MYKFTLLDFLDTFYKVLIMTQDPNSSNQLYFPNNRLPNHFIVNFKFLYRVGKHTRTCTNTHLRSFILGSWPFVAPPHQLSTPLHTGVAAEGVKRRRKKHNENKTQPHLLAPVLLRNLMGDISSEQLFMLSQSHSVAYGFISLLYTPPHLPSPSMSLILSASLTPSNASLFAFLSFFAAYKRFLSLASVCN